MNQDLKLVIQFVYYHQTVFPNKFVPVYIKFHSKGTLTLNLFKIEGYREKRYRKKYKKVCFTFDRIFEGFLTTNYMAKFL